MQRPIILDLDSQELRYGEKAGRLYAQSVLFLACLAKTPSEPVSLKGLAADLWGGGTTSNPVSSLSTAKTRVLSAAKEIGVQIDMPFVKGKGYVLRTDLTVVGELPTACVGSAPDDGHVYASSLADIGNDRLRVVARRPIGEPWIWFLPISEIGKFKKMRDEDGILVGCTERRDGVDYHLSRLSAGGRR